MSVPEVSVVMSVYNGATYLEETLISILSQEGCDFEFIVVNDGSTDVGPEILDDWAVRDSRLRVIHQQNMGLTRALVRGCVAARGVFIARQDAGDISLPGRLLKQSQRLNADEKCVAVSCQSEFVGPRDELLYYSQILESTLNQTLASVDSCTLAGPAGHGTVMMRSAAYMAVGGYRSEFYFAQDLDLWSRLVELGPFAVVPEVLFRVRLEPLSISGIQTVEQRELAKLIASAAAVRRTGQAEDAILAQAATIRPVAKGDLQQRLARGNYFIGSCLRSRDPKASAEYFRKAIEHDPTHWRAWLRLAETRFRGLL